MGDFMEDPCRPVKVIFAVTASVTAISQGPSISISLSGRARRGLGEGAAQVMPSVEIIRWLVRKKGDAATWIGAECRKGRLIMAGDLANMGRDQSESIDLSVRRSWTEKRYINNKHSKRLCDLVHTTSSTIDWWLYLDPSLSKLEAIC
jgi:hypothetical protein